MSGDLVHRGKNERPLKKKKEKKEEEEEEKKPDTVKFLFWSQEEEKKKKKKKKKSLTLWSFSFDLFHTCPIEQFEIVGPCIMCCHILRNSLNGTSRQFKF